MNYIFVVVVVVVVVVVLLLLLLLLLLFLSCSCCCCHGLFLIDVLVLFFLHHLSRAFFKATLHLALAVPAR